MLYLYHPPGVLHFNFLQMFDCLCPFSIEVGSGMQLSLSIVLLCCKLSFILVLYSTVFLQFLGHIFLGLRVV